MASCLAGLAGLARSAVLLSLLSLPSLVACGQESSPAPATPPTEPPPSEEQDAAPAPDPYAEKIDAFFAAAAAKDTFSGSVVVVDGGKTILSKGYGPAVREPVAPNAPETIFRIGSVTKQFTAAAILALAEDGKIAITDPVSKYFPEIPKENLEKDGVEVTLHHLLSHTSGMPDGRSTTYFKDNVWTKPIDKQALIDATSPLPLVRKPGLAYEYLNYGFFLLGVLIERVSGVSYELFLHDRFFGPLAMDDTGTTFPKEKDARRATGYTKEDDEFLTIEDDPIFGDPDVTFAFGSGQIYSTTLDLVKWDRAIAAGRVARTDLLFKANLSKYGYGWVIEKRKGVDYQWHNGALSPLGFASLIVRVPSKDRFVGYLANMDITIVEALQEKVTTLALE